MRAVRWFWILAAVLVLVGCGRPAICFRDDFRSGVICSACENRNGYELCLCSRACQAGKERCCCLHKCTCTCAVMRKF